jgi:hypothetical protein
MAEIRQFVATSQSKNRFSRYWVGDEKTMRAPKMIKHPSEGVVEVQKSVAKSVERLGRQRDLHLRALQRVERELEALRPVVAVVFGKEVVRA